MNRVPCSASQFYRRLDSTMADSQCLVSPLNAFVHPTSVQRSMKWSTGLQPSLSPQLDTMSSKQPAQLSRVALGSFSFTSNLTKERMLLFIQDDTAWKVLPVSSISDTFVFNSLCSQLLTPCHVAPLVLLLSIMRSSSSVFHYLCLNSFA